MMSEKTAQYKFKPVTEMMRMKVTESDSSGSMSLMPRNALRAIFRVVSGQHPTSQWPPSS